MNNEGRFFFAEIHLSLCLIKISGISVSIFCTESSQFHISVFAKTTEEKLKTIIK